MSPSQFGVLRPLSGEVSGSFLFVEVLNGLLDPLDETLSAFFLWLRLNLGQEVSVALDVIFLCSHVRLQEYVRSFSLHLSGSVDDVFNFLEELV